MGIKTMILCGGMGTRLKEQTETKPKPMVEIGGRPILWHIMKHYAHFGLNEFVLCLGFKGKSIKEYFLNYEAMNHDFTLTLGNGREISYHGTRADECQWTVTLVDTGEHSMTGARVARAASHTGQSTFALTYGDGVSNVDLNALLAFHRSHGGLATMTGVRPPGRFGEFNRDGDRITAFNEKPTNGRALINGGFFLLEPGFLRYLSSEPDCILERAPLERCAADGQLFLYEHDGFWQCMDTYRDWSLLENLWQSGDAPWRIWA